MITFDTTYGIGTKEDPKHVYGIEDLNALYDAVNIKGTTYVDYYFKYIIEDDTTISLGNFNSIGNNTTRFRGNFDGSGMNFDLNINRNQDYVGLFGYVQSGVIENLSVSGNVKGINYIGGVSGYSSSATIQNVYNTANIEASEYAGGIVGSQSGGLITNTINFGDIKANSNAGGIAGTNNAVTTISNSYSKGMVQVSVLENTAYGVSSTIAASSNRYIIITI